MKISKILIANRGEIALRIMRTCRRLGINTVAVYSTADAKAPYVQYADEAYCLGEPQPSASYLVGEAIVTAAEATGAEAIHPGYGFLSENAGFAALVHQRGLIFIGPSPMAIASMGGKIESKMLAKQLEVPTIPGYQGDQQSVDKLEAHLQDIGFPALVKASAGGGGRGMRIVRQAAEAREAIESAKREALNAFGDERLLIERYFDSSRHVEIQVLGDQHGHVVHLSERDCSVQRRHQKVLEETPSPLLPAVVRRRMGEAAVRLASAIGYHGAGTVEFLVDDQGEFYFLEMNTRLQVEHPVTEAVFGLDLVELQIAVAEGKELPFAQEDLEPKGAAIEARLCAEDPANNFLPVSGPIHHLYFPEVEGVRYDAGVVSGSEVSPYYDSMIAKVIAYGADREQALRRLRYALQHTTVLGIRTNQEYLEFVLDSDAFASGNYDTRFVGQHTEAFAQLHTSASGQGFAAIAALLLLWHSREAARDSLKGLPGGWRNSFYAPAREVFVLDATQEVRVDYRFLGKNRFELGILESGVEQPSVCVVELQSIEDHSLSFTLEGMRYRYRYAVDGDMYHLHNPRHGYSSLKLAPAFPDLSKKSEPGDCISPMPGQVARLLVEAGAQVEENQPLLVLISMKMENTLYAPVAGTVLEVFVSEGVMVQADELLIKLQPQEA